MDAAAVTMPTHQVLLDTTVRTDDKTTPGDKVVPSDCTATDDEELLSSVEMHIEENGDLEVVERNGVGSLGDKENAEAVSIQNESVPQSEDVIEVMNCSENGFGTVTGCPKDGSDVSCKDNNNLENVAENYIMESSIPTEVIAETESFLTAERKINNVFINKETNLQIANGGSTDSEREEINDDIAPMTYSEDDNVWVTDKEESQEQTGTDSLRPVEIKQLEEIDAKGEADNTLLIIEDTDDSARHGSTLPEPHKLELHISESDLLEKDIDIVEPLTIETSDSRGGESSEVYSCQSSPGYIKSPSARSAIIKQNSLDTQITSDDEADIVRSKRGSLHSPSSKIITKLTPITWDQWMKRPASYIPPSKPSPTSQEPPTIVVDAAPEEPKTAPVGESPKVKKTRFQIIPQTSDVLDTNRDDSPKTLETFDETEEDQFLLENPNVLLESHLNELTMVETQLKKLGAAAKAGSKKLAQKPETDGKAMKRTSSADEKGKGWLNWLSVFTKRPTPPSPPPKKQQARRRQPQQRPRRLDAPPLLPDYSKIPVIIEVRTKTWCVGVNAW